MNKTLRFRARLRTLRRRRREAFYDARRRELLRAMQDMPIDATRHGYGSWHAQHLQDRGKDAMGFARG